MSKPVASLVVTVLPDQTQEVYNKDDTTFIRGVAPQYRDASDFTTPSSDPLYVSIDGLSSNQHGFKLVNPQYLAQQSYTKNVSASQKEEIKKQDEFVKSILEANSAAINPQKAPSNIFRPSQPLASSRFENSGAFKSDSLDETRFGALDLFGTGVPEDTFITADTGETTTHSVFDFQFPQQHKGPLSQKELLHNGRDSVGRKSPKPIHRNDFSGFQSDTSVNNGERKHSFIFRERATTPAAQQVDDAGSAYQEFGRFGQASFSSEAPAFTRINAKPNRKPTDVVKSDRNPSSWMNPATFTPRPSVAEPSVASGFSITGEDKYGTRQQPNFFKLQSSFGPVASRFEIRGQGADDEESKFISQINQKTASFVSKNARVNGFEEPLSQGFETIQETPGRTTDVRAFPQDFSGAAHFADTKRRKESGQRSRRPIQNKGAPEDRLPTLPPIPANRFSTPNKFQTANTGEPEQEVIDREAEARKQAEGAKYSFASTISDTVNDNSQSRQEVRDGLKLQGMYSYSDGYFKRTVYYEADEGGYRVVKEESEPIGNGPQFDPNGEVQVNYRQGGSNLQYNIRGDQLRRTTKKGARVETAPRFDDYHDQLELPN